MAVKEFRCYWNNRWSGYYGSFEDTTKIPPMRFTYTPVPKVVVDSDTLQIFSVKLAATREDLELPLDVFGTSTIIAILSSIAKERTAKPSPKRAH
nr:unnamed protein product [Digitaria exilis]